MFDIKEEELTSYLLEQVDPETNTLTVGPGVLTLMSCMRDSKYKAILSGTRVWQSTTDILSKTEPSHVGTIANGTIPVFCSGYIADDDIVSRFSSL